MFAQEVLALKQCGQICYMNKKIASHWLVSHCVQPQLDLVCVSLKVKGMNSIGFGEKNSTKANCSGTE